MFINFTLVIQACNFFVAYKVLRILLFKPAVQTLQQERSVQENLLLHIDTTTIMIATREQEKSDQWQQFQQLFVRQIPEITKEELFIFKGLTPELRVPLLADEHIQNLEREVTKSIVKRLEHVRA